MAEEIDSVKIEFVYPSQLQESTCRPPFPEAQINIEPSPRRPCRVKEREEKKNIRRHRGEASKNRPRPKLVHFVFLKYSKNGNLISKKVNVVLKLR